MITEEFKNVYRLLNGAESDFEEYHPDGIKNDRIEALDSAWSGVYDAMNTLEKIKGSLTKMLNTEESN